MKTEEAKNFSKPEAEMVDVMDTLLRVISIIEQEIAKNLTILQKGIDTRNTNNATVLLITKEDLNVNGFQQTVSMMNDVSRGPLKLGTLTTVENAHNTADDWRHLVAKITLMSMDRRDSIRHRPIYRGRKRFAFA